MVIVALRDQSSQIVLVIHAETVVLPVMFCQLSEVQLCFLRVAQLAKAGDYADKNQRLEIPVRDL